MKSARLADLLFTGLAIVPALLLLDGHPGIAIVVFPPLLIAACLCGAYEQALDAAVERKSRRTDGGRGGGSAPPPAMFALRSTPDA